VCQHDCRKCLSSTSNNYCRSNEGAKCCTAGSSDCETTQNWYEFGARNFTLKQLYVPLSPIKVDDDGDLEETGEEIEEQELLANSTSLTSGDNQICSSTLKAVIS